MLEGSTDSSRGKWVRWVLLAVLFAGAALRLYDVNWDSGQHMHPDERWIIMVTSSLSWPERLSDALHPHRSTFNPFYSPSEGKPRHFAYGHFPLYLLRLLAVALTKLAPLTGSAGLARALDFDHLTLLGRILSALFDTGTILLVYLLGERLYGRTAGLLAAAFLAFTVMHIQLSHFYAVDVVMAFFAVAAVYFDVCVVQRDDLRSSILAGVCTGLAVASKFSAAPLVLPLAAAHLLKKGRGGGGQGRKVAQGLFLSLLAAFLVYAITSPYVLLDFRSFVKSIGWEGKMVRGAVDLPYTRQYRRTVPYIYQIEQQLRWGMGWPLGIAGFSGLAWAIYRAARRRASPAELVALAWVVPYFLVNGSFMVKFMRYMVLVTPFLGLFGAGMLQGANGRGVWRRLSIGIVLTGTVLWVAAFMHIYTEPLTRVRASEWIYRHIPPGTTITNEDWDDRLPFNLEVDGEFHTCAEYNIVKMALQEPDDEAKFHHIVDALTRADYVIVSSKRFYGWLPRLRDRFPITNRYYDLLFAEKLGFKLVKVFTSYPRLGPLTIVDDKADESFTVYDHPKVLIFQKERQLSEGEFRELFAGSLRGEGARPPRGKTLLLSGPVDELPVVDDFRWNGLANRHHLLGALFWWFAVEVIGLAAWPLTFLTFRRLRDRGYILSKSLGLLIVAYLVWLPASLHLLRNALPTHLLVLSLLFLFSLCLFLRRREEMAAFWRERRRLIALNEVLFAFAFFAFVGIRVLNPDLWHPWNGGEKMMEIAFLNACLKSAYFPPYDPYFAGGYINYYYYGQFLVAVLIKLTGIMPLVAFNLAVPMLFALTVSNAFCVGFNLSRGQGIRDRGFTGLLAALFVAVLGNLDGMVQVVRKLGEIGGSNFRSAIPGLEGLVRAVPGLLKVLGGHPWPSFDYWGPTRVIPHTINEFPFFSFLFADLHPHTIAMPFTILALALALNILSRGRGQRIRGQLPASGFQFLISSFCLGALAVINTWDLPTYFILLAIALLIRQGLSALLLAPSLLLLALLLYWPFLVRYQALYTGVGLVKGPTGLGYFLDIWGLFLFLALSLLAVELTGGRSRLGILRLLRLALTRWDLLPHFLELHRALVRRPTPGYLLGLGALGGITALALGLALLGRWVLALLLPSSALAFLLLLNRRDSEELFALLLIALGLSVLLGCELFYLRDFLAGSEYYRMNTVFKLYIQAWVLLGLGTGAALPRIWARVREWRTKWRWAWEGAFILLLLSSLVYPILGTPARVADRFPGARPPLGTLDGMAYMEVGSYTWPKGNRIELRYDYEAIRWLLDNVKGTPVIAEAAIGYYREGGLRVSSYTGLPTLLGMHQSEQRYPHQVGERDGKVREFFNTPDLIRARQLIEELRISYIYIGQLERTVYSSAGLAKFDRMAEEGDLRLIYTNERVRIYKVVRTTAVSDPRPELRSSLDGMRRFPL